MPQTKWHDEGIYRHTVWRWNISPIMTEEKSVHEILCVLNFPPPPRWGQVNLVSEHIWCKDFLVRSFYLKNVQTQETRTLTQFHLLSWPANGIPTSTRPLLDFRRSEMALPLTVWLFLYCFWRGNRSRMNDTQHRTESEHWIHSIHPSAPFHPPCSSGSQTFRLRSASLPLPQCAGWSVCVLPSPSVIFVVCS